MAVKSVLIVVPPLVNRQHQVSGPHYKYLDFETYRLVSPIEPATIAAALDKKGFTPFIFDLGACEDDGFDTLAKRMETFKPDAVVVASAILTFGSSFDYDGKYVFDVARKTRPGCVTVLTGTHATNHPGKAVKDGLCDYSIRGEPDLVLAEFLETLNSSGDLNAVAGLSYKNATEPGAVISSAAYPKLNPEDLPIPAYRFTDPEQRPMYSKFLEFGKIRFPEKSAKYRDIMTSRSCILRCSFCSVAHLRGEEQRYRRKPLDNVIREIEGALEDGMEELHFFDDLFAKDEKQIFEFTNEIVKRNLKFNWFVAQGFPLWTLTYDALSALKETGFYRLIGPFESGNNRVLKRVVGKLTTVEHNHNVIGWAKKLDLEVIGMFVVGMPSETREELYQTMQFAEAHPEIDYCVFSIATPLVGTKMTAQAKKEGYYDEDKGDLNKVIKRTVGLYETPEFTQIELGLIRTFDWDRINFTDPAKRAKYAKMVGITLEQLELARKTSRETFYHYYPDYKGPLSFIDAYQQQPVLAKADEKAHVRPQII